MNAQQFRQIMKEVHDVDVCLFFQKGTEEELFYISPEGGDLIATSYLDGKVEEWTRNSYEMYESGAYSEVLDTLFEGLFPRETEFQCSLEQWVGYLGNPNGFYSDYNKKPPIEWTLQMVERLKETAAFAIGIANA